MSKSVVSNEEEQGDGCSHWSKWRTELGTAESWEDKSSLRQVVGFFLDLHRIKIFCFWRTQDTC